jgi:hypothetical protein
MKTGLILLGLIAATAGIAQAKDFKAGAWEMKMVRKMDQNEITASKHMEDAAKRMKPEDRARIEAGMKSSGAVNDLATGTQTITTKVCIPESATSAEFRPASVPKSCEFKVTRSGNTATSTWNCPDQKISGVQVTTFNSQESFTSKATTKMPHTATPMEMITTSRYIGADCKGLPSPMGK